MLLSDLLRTAQEGPSGLEATVLVLLIVASEVYLGVDELQRIWNVQATCYLWIEFV